MLSRHLLWSSNPNISKQNHKKKIASFSLFYWHNNWKSNTKHKKAIGTLSLSVSLNFITKVKNKHSSWQIFSFKFDLILLISCKNYIIFPMSFVSRTNWNNKEIIEQSNNNQILAAKFIAAHKE